MAEGNAPAGAGSSSGPMDFGAAFEAALGTGGTAEGSGTEENTTDTSDAEEATGDDTEGGTGTDSEDDTSAAQSEEERQAEEASTGDEDETADTDDSATGEEGSAESGTPDLTNGDADSPKLKALLSKLSPETQKEARAYINKSLQPKFQAVAAARGFLEAFQKDPVAAAYQVLREKGVTVPETGAPSTTTAAGTAAQPSEIAASLTKAGFSKEQVAAVEAIVSPLAQKQNAADIARVASEMEGAVESFKTTHPEYDRLEPTMSKLMDEMPPTPSILKEGGPRLQKYLANLYTLALGPEGQKKAVAKGVKSTIKKITDNASSASPRTRGVPASTVQPGKSGPLSISDSFEMALRGETRGRGIKTRA